MNRNLKIFADIVEQEAIDQIDLLLAQPAFSDCKVRIMPDVHAGAGCVIGFTADLGDKVIPNVVGVDIGCGMLTIQFEGDLDFDKLDRVIRKMIPSGLKVHDEWEPFYLYHAIGLEMLKSIEVFENLEYFQRSLGTLGGGNHFIEVDVDSEGRNYLVIHTGSRNLGKRVAEYYQKEAIKREYGTSGSLKELRRQIAADLKSKGRETEIASAIAALNKAEKERAAYIPQQLCYLTGNEREKYLEDMQICQRFAEVNREQIASTILHGMNWRRIDSFETVHNYIDFETNIVRKGAVSAKLGEKLLIPLNMRDGSLICIGKGNDDWNQSAPHGAGRIMSRRAAKEKLTLEKYKESMDGIYSTSINLDTIDEAPAAYKPVSAIAPLIGDTVEIINHIRPVYNFKAGE